MAQKHFAKQEWAESIYYSYTSLIIAAKAILLSEDVKCNTQAGIVDDFHEHFIDGEKIDIGTSFPQYVFQINANEPSEAFATAYLKDAKNFIETLLKYSNSKTGNINDKEVVEISIVGAGPGAADLITVRGLNAIKSANVILYDALVNKALLKEAKPNCELIFVGKRSGKHSFKQEEINQLLIENAFNYKHVVRLKGGDPFIFGRGHEELTFLQAFIH